MLKKIKFILFALCAMNMYAQQTSVKGKVIDENKIPIPSVNVVVKGTTVGTSTDMDGNFNLVLPENATNLKVSYIGYTQQLLPIKSEDMKIYLVESQLLLNEITIMDDKVTTGWDYDKNCAAEKRCLAVVDTDYDGGGRTFTRR